MGIKDSSGLKSSNTALSNISIDRRRLLRGMAVAGGLGLAGKNLLDVFSPSSDVLAAPQGSAASRYPKGGAGSLTGDYDTPDPKWPLWAHPYPKPGYIWGSQGGVFAESPNRIYLLNRGELKLPDKVPPNFTGDWGFLNSQAAGQPIANMVNCIVVVDGQGETDRSVEPVGQTIRMGPWSAFRLHQSL